MPKANDTTIISNHSHPHTVVHTYIYTHAHTHTHWWNGITLTCFVNFHYPAAVGRARSVWTFRWPTGHWSVSSTPALCCDCSVNLPSASSRLSLTWTQYTNTIQNSGLFAGQQATDLYPQLLLCKSAWSFFTSVFNMNSTNFVFLTTLQTCLQLLHVCLTWTQYSNTINNFVCWLLCRPAFAFFMSITTHRHNTKFCVLTALQTCLQLPHVCLTWIQYINTILCCVLTALQTCLCLLRVHLTWTQYKIVCADCSADLPLPSSCPSDLTQYTNTIQNSVC